MLFGRSRPDRVENGGRNKHGSGIRIGTGIEIRIEVETGTEI